ncbi:hypothetical protein DAMA08_022610 [Martiniozyma asiatica (nom. inval.)]|nr:hypothetical protein DAMA08_022610 [Martiniozyma asiatica]
MTKDFVQQNNFTYMPNYNDDPLNDSDVISNSPFNDLKIEVSPTPNYRAISEADDDDRDDDDRDDDDDDDEFSSPFSGLQFESNRSESNAHSHFHRTAIQNQLSADYVNEKNNNYNINSFNNSHYQNNIYSRNHRYNSTVVSFFPPAEACTPPVLKINNEIVSKRSSISSIPSVDINFNFSSLNRLEDALSHDEYSDDFSSFTQFENDAANPTSYKLVRGIHTGGLMGKPQLSNDAKDSFTFERVKLKFKGSKELDICFPEWSKEEIEEGRRIVRFEKVQFNETILITCSIVKLNIGIPDSGIGENGNLYLEISCLRCISDDRFGETDNVHIIAAPGTNIKHLPSKYYVTSVDVLKLVEFLINMPKDLRLIEKRKERGRIRSNLVSFWSKNSVSTKLPVRPSTKGKTNAHFRLDLANNIMSYKYRKPRGFDKEVRVLEWKVLIKALKRALLNYFVEIPIKRSE